MKKTSTMPTVAFALATAMLMGCAPVHAADTGDKPAKSQHKKKPAKEKAKAQGGKATFVRGSEESVAERTARLKRECKGGVNAGACAGFTR